MTLTKAHVVEAVAEQTGFPKKKSSEMVEILLELIKIALNWVRIYWALGFEISGGIALVV